MTLCDTVSPHIPIQKASHIPVWTAISRHHADSPCSTVWQVPASSQLVSATNEQGEACYTTLLFYSALCSAHCAFTDIISPCRDRLTRRDRRPQTGFRQVSLASSASNRNFLCYSHVLLHCGYCRSWQTPVTRLLSISSQLVTTSQTVQTSKRAMAYRTSSTPSQMLSKNSCKTDRQRGAAWALDNSGM